MLWGGEFFSFKMMPEVPDVGSSICSYSWGLRKNWFGQQFVQSKVLFMLSVSAQTPSRSLPCEHLQRLLLEHICSFWRLRGLAGGAPGHASEPDWGQPLPGKPPNVLSSQRDGKTTRPTCPPPPPQPDSSRPPGLRISFPAPQDVKASKRTRVCVLLGGRHYNHL